jgi:hypothetical protein
MFRPTRAARGGAEWVFSGVPPRAAQDKWDSNGPAPRAAPDVQTADRDDCDGRS